jgi:hypothetical protein
MKTYFVNSAVVIVAAVIGGVCTPGALAAGFVCPSGGTPAPGSDVRGGLEVSPGVCVVDGVTVSGGITVDTNGHLQLQSSTVNGGILVKPGGELDINAFTLGSGVPTGTTATIHGGITINNPYDLDLETATIDGGITQTGSGGPGFVTTVCGNSISGATSFSNGTFQLGGGPVVNNSSINCAGDSFDGTVSLTNATVYMGDNTIRGSLLCSNSHVIVVTPNTITGKNTCY